MEVPLEIPDVVPVPALAGSTEAATTCPLARRRAVAEAATAEVTTRRPVAEATPAATEVTPRGTVAETAPAGAEGRPARRHAGGTATIAAPKLRDAGH